MFLTLFSFSFLAPLSSSTVLNTVPVGTTEYEISAEITKTADKDSLDGVFYQCRSTLSKVTFETNSVITEIGRYTFQQCLLLKKIIIPKSVTRIGQGAFMDSGINEIIFDDYQNSNLESIEYLSLYRIPLAAIQFPTQNFHTIYENTLSHTLIKSLTIPKCVKIIKSYAFQTMKYLEEINFVENCQITIINSYTFASCSSLKSFTVPSSLNFIELAAFSGTTSLTHFKVHPSNPYFFIGDDSVSLYKKGANSGQILSIVPSGYKVGPVFNIKEGVEEISSNGFNNVNIITHIILPAVHSVAVKM